MLPAPQPHKPHSLLDGVYDTLLMVLAPRRGPSGGGGSHAGGSEGGGGDSSGGSSGSSGSKGTGSDAGGSSSSSGKTPSEPPPPYDPPPSYHSSQSSFRTTTGSTVAAYGGGSTTIRQLPAGQPFAGRSYDGGTRYQVYGTRTLGSGYPYGAGGFWLIGRPFPFGFWPIYYHPYYYGDDEYGPENNSSRPGGAESTALIVSPLAPAPPPSNATANSTSPSNSTNPNTYYLLGDSDSVRAVLDALVLNCSVTNSSITPYSANASGSPQPYQAVQYYRASSFALLLQGYNNSAALPSNAPPSNTTASNITVDTPLPGNLNMTFLDCLNQTVGNAVPMTNESRAMGMTQMLAAGQVWGVLAFWMVVWGMMKRL